MCQHAYSRVVEFTIHVHVLCLCVCVYGVLNYGLKCTYSICLVCHASVITVI